MAANPLPLVALPGDDLVWLGTVSMSNEDAAYPATNLQNADPADVAKSTTTTTSITITTPSVAVVAIALINTNATTAGIPSPASAIIIPALDPDGQHVHGWLDLRLAPVTQTTWQIDLSVVSGVVWIGRIVIVTAIHELKLRYGLQLGRQRPGDVEIRTRLGSVIRHGAQIRTRTAIGQVNVLDNYALMTQLEASAKGSLLPFLFIPDEATNDAWWVTFRSNDFAVGFPDYDVREVAVAFEELSGGPPNG